MLMRRKIVKQLAALMAVAIVTSVSADTINVPGDFLTIQEAIDVAIEGDEILVAPGTYFENLDLIGKNIILHGEHGPEVTIVDGGDVRAVLRATSGESPSSLIEGFTLQNGRGEVVNEVVYGGGVYINGASPTLNNCIIKDNYAYVSGQNYPARGGGIYAINSQSLIENCFIAANRTSTQTSNAFGGGAYCSSGVILRNCIISGNQIFGASAKGGGIWIAGTLEDCTIKFNQAQNSTLGTGVFAFNALIINTFICSNWSGEGEDNDLWGTFTDGGGNAIQDDCPVECPTPCTGDVDDNKEVNVTDLLILFANWGPCP